MVFQFIAMLRDDLPLPALDLFIDELNHLTVVNTNHMIVVMIGGDFEYCVAAIKVMPLHNAGRFELRKHSIDGREADIFTGVD